MSAAATPETDTTRAEIALLEVAVALVALHAIVDSFLALEPGTACEQRVIGFFDTALLWKPDP